MPSKSGAFIRIPFRIDETDKRLGCQGSVEFIYDGNSLSIRVFDSDEDEEAHIQDEFIYDGQDFLDLIKFLQSIPKADQPENNH